MEENKGIRLAKFLADRGIASRRTAEKYIEAGLVKVNGKYVETPAFNVTESDEVIYDGRLLSAKREETRLWRYYKPVGIVCTHNDPEGRTTLIQRVLEKLPSHVTHIISVGRLDLNSEGLILLTNNGELARKLEHPSTGWTRRYRVRVHGNVTQEKLDSLKEGVTVDGMQYQPIIATLESKQGTNSWVSVSLKEGKNREIRRVMEYMGYQVSRLLRVAYGPFQLGSMEKDTLTEVPSKTLKEQVGKYLS